MSKALLVVVTVLTLFQLSTAAVPSTLKTVYSLNRGSANTLIAAAIVKATNISKNVCVAVADAEGVLLAFQRMDNASISGVDFAIGKAFTSVARNANTTTVSAASVPGGITYGLFAVAGGKYVSFDGGVPIYSMGNQLVGAIGVSGGKDLDNVICTAAIKALALPA